MKILKYLLIVYTFWVVATGAYANGDKGISRECDPFPINRYTTSFDPEKFPTLKVDPSTFSAVPLSEEDTKFGFVAKRETDHSYVVIPNKINMTLVSWVIFKKTKTKTHSTCASRLVATFQPDTESSDYSTLVKKIKSLDSQAAFLRPIIQDVKVEFPLPFIGYLRRFDPHPVYPLGGVLIVWDLDKENTTRLQEFMKNSKSPAEIPGIILFYELQTGLTFSTSISIDRDRLLESIIEMVMN